jgi:hypothetical protein
MKPTPSAIIAIIVIISCGEPLSSAATILDVAVAAEQNCGATIQNQLWRPEERQNP